MKPARYFIALLLAGCSPAGNSGWRVGTILYVFHDHIEIDAKPQFELHLGSDSSIKCFDRTTDIQFGSTNCIIGLPYYILLVGAIAPFALVVILWARRKTNKEEPENS